MNQRDRAALDRASLDTLLVRAAEDVKAQTEELGRLDGLFGDGDHGVSMSKIADLIIGNVNVNTDLDTKAHLNALGTAIMNMGGGSASFLWGALFQGLSLPLAAGEASFGPARLVDMLSGALAEMMDVSTARVGDKTLMDALIPAVEAARSTLPTESVDSVLVAAAKGAAAGVEHTKTVAAKFGRAKNYKEQTIGTPDPGAVSMAVFFGGLAR